MSFDWSFPNGSIRVPESIGSSPDAISAHEVVVPPAKSTYKQALQHCIAAGPMAFPWHSSPGPWSASNVLECWKRGLIFWFINADFLCQMLLDVDTDVHSGNVSPCPEFLQEVQILFFSAPYNFEAKSI